MATLHAALQSLGPCKFDELPNEPTELDTYINRLFSQSQLILESIPIPLPDQIHDTRSRSNTASSVASNASEIIASSARSAPPSAEYVSLQKEWGKPIKLSAKENPLGMCVYKMSGKDGRGAWFARRSVHEGLAFAKFKKSLEMEFPESLAVKGAPGEGNIRGIGGDRKLEDLSVPGKGRVEVFQLSAQFPGPTTPRDFVTLLVTSSNAVKQSDASGRPDLSPPHYMIISKPCDHPDSQPRNGYVRGNYESVEFIREVPRLPKKTRSSMDLSRMRSGSRSPLAKEAVRRNAERSHVRDQPTTQHHLDRVKSDLEGISAAGDEVNRRRGKTISFSGPREDEDKTPDNDSDDPEINPVEWIMVTRSDPGGSVPRFMVERGTPGSIVADASKFLDWACQIKTAMDESGIPSPTAEMDHRRDSFASYETNGRLAGVNDASLKSLAALNQTPSATSSVPSSQADSSIQIGMMPGIRDASTNGPAIRPGLPGRTAQGSEDATAGDLTVASAELDGDMDSFDSLSETSFASADSHFYEEPRLDTSIANNAPSVSTTTSDDKNGVPNKTVKEKEKTKDYTAQQQKELNKLTAKRKALDAKLASTRERTTTNADAQSQTARSKEMDSLRKAEERHARETSKSEQKYHREITKLEQRRRREELKADKRRSKEAAAADKTSDKTPEKDKVNNNSNKDDRRRLQRELDHARTELVRVRTERDLFLRQVGELQRENTALVVRIGRLEGVEIGASLRREIGSGTVYTATTSATASTPSASTSIAGSERGRGGLDVDPAPATAN